MSNFTNTWKNLSKSNDNSKGETQAYRERLKGLSKAEALSVLKTEYGLTEKQASQIVADAIQKSMSRVYGAHRKKEDQAYVDLYRMVGEVEGNICQAYLDYDKDENTYYACITIGDKSIGLVQSDMASRPGDEEILESDELEKSQLAKTSRMYGGKHLTEDEAYQDLASIVRQNSGRVLQAYIEYDEDAGLYSGEVTLKDGKVQKAAKKDKKIEWITVGGKHVPIKPGQSKDEAVRSAGVGDKKKKPNSESKKPEGKKGGRGSWSEDERGYDYKRMSVKQLEDQLDGHYRDLDELGEDADGGSEYGDIERAINELEGELERAKKEKKTQKDIRPYGQKFQAAGILKTESEEHTAEDYEVDATNFNNINNMDPGINGETSNYETNPTYAMTNDEATKMINDLKQQLSKIESQIFKSSRFERKELIIQHTELSSKLEKAIKDEAIIKNERINNAVDFRKTAKTPSLKEVLATRFEKRLSNSEKAALCDQVIDRFREGDYGWKQRAILFMQGKGAGMNDIAEILDAVLEDTAFNE